MVKFRREHLQASTPAIRIRSRALKHGRNSAPGMQPDSLFLGIDGGGTRCRARLCTAAGTRIGEAVAGPANVRLNLEQSFAAVLDASRECVQQAGLPQRAFSTVTACLALAGASEPTALVAALRHALPFARAIITSDARAACVGAHRGRDGGVIVAGTGTVGWAEIGGRSIRIGGWGPPISDEGSGGWIGVEALRRVLWAHDGRIAWTELLSAIFRFYKSDPHGIVRWSETAAPGDFGSLAPLVIEHANRGDPDGRELMILAASHVDALAGRLISVGVRRLALVGGMAEHLEPYVAPGTRSHLVAPAGDALDGALQLAQSAAEPLERAVPLQGGS
jgi:glucosamine kinase